MTDLTNRIQEQLGRQVETKSKGGDRKSEQFKSNRVIFLARNT